MHSILTQMLCVCVLCLILRKDACGLGKLHVYFQLFTFDAFQRIYSISFRFRWIISIMNSTEYDRCVSAFSHTRWMVIQLTADNTSDSLKLYRSSVCAKIVLWSLKWKLSLYCKIMRSHADITTAQKSNLNDIRVVLSSILFASFHLSYYGLYTVFVFVFFYLQSTLSHSTMKYAVFFPLHCHNSICFSLHLYLLLCRDPTESWSIRCAFSSAIS